MSDEELNTVKLPDWLIEDPPMGLIPYCGRNKATARAAMKVKSRDVMSERNFFNFTIRHILERKKRGIPHDDDPEFNALIGKRMVTTMEAARTVGRYLVACIDDPRVKASPEVLALMLDVQRTLNLLPFPSDKLPLANGPRLEIERALGRKESSKKAIEAKKQLDRGGKFAAKESVRGCWLYWQKKPSNYKSKAKFASDMLFKFPELKSARVIEDWCREWEKGSKK